MVKFRDFDIYSSPFTYSITFKVKMFKTKTGACCSLIFFLLLSLSAFFFFSKYSDTTAPRVMIKKETQKNYPKINLHGQKAIPAGILLSSDKMLHSSESSKYFTGFFTKYERKINKTTGKEETIVKGTQKVINAFHTISGEEDIDESIIVSGAYNYYKTGFISGPEDLSDNEFWTIEGSEKSLPYSYITLAIYPCSLPDSSHCAPIQSLSEYDFSLSVAHLTYKLDKKKNPIFRLYEYDVLSIALNPSAFAKSEINMKKIIILDEDRDFVQPRLNSEFYNLGKIDSYSKFRPLDIYCTPTSITNGTCVPYGTVTFKSGNEVHTVLRIYPKLFSSLSELGGFGDLIFILLGFFVYLFNQSQLDKYVQKLTPSIDSLGKYGKRKEMSKKEKKNLEKIFLKKKMSSIDLMTTTTMFEGFCLALMDQPYEETLDLIPLIEKVSGNRTEDIDPKTALKKVLNSKPKNDLERIIKKKIEELIIFDPMETGRGENVNDGLMDMIDLDSFEERKQRKKGKRGKKSGKRKNTRRKKKRKKEIENKIQKKMRRVKRKNNKKKNSSRKSPNMNTFHNIKNVRSKNDERQEKIMLYRNKMIRIKKKESN